MIDYNVSVFLLKECILKIWYNCVYHEKSIQGGFGLTTLLRVALQLALSIQGSNSQIQLTKDGKYLGKNNNKMKII